VTDRRFESLARKHLLPKMPDFCVSRYLLFVLPLHYIIRGYCFEGSSDPNGFYVWAFVQPLFVPDRGVSFVIGNRLGLILGQTCGAWSLTADNEEVVMADVWGYMQREGRIILDKFQSLRAFAKNAINRRTNPHSPYPPEMVAYAAVLLGDVRLARKMFDRLEWTLRDQNDREPYENDILKRARLVRETLERDRGEAVGIMNKWREETAANLKLTRFLAPLPGSS